MDVFGKDQWMQGWSTAIWSASMAALLGGIYYLYSNPYHIINWINRLGAWGVGWKRRSIKLERDYNISYVERGEAGGDDRPTVLFIHGYGGNADNWNLVVKNISQKHHLVAINLPGHEYSSCDANKDLCMEGMLSRLHEFIAAIGLGTANLHIVGSSMGAAISGCYAAKNPTFVKKLTLVSALITTPEDSQLVKIIKDTEYNPLADMSKEGLKQTLNLCLNRDLYIPRPIFAAVLDYRQRRSEYHTKLMNNLVMPHILDEKDPFLTEKAPCITSPTQVVWGEEDRVMHASGATVLKSLLPNLRKLDILPNIGHSIDMMAPKVLAELLETFMAEDYSNDIDC